MFDGRLRTLYEAHNDAVMRVLHIRRVIPSAVEDVALDAWIDISRKSPEDVPDFIRDNSEGARSGRARAWVLAFARHRAMRWHRDTGRDPVAIAADELAEPSDPSASPEELTQRASDYDALRSALETLDEEARALIEDVHLLDMSKIDAARARCWSESMARRRLDEACEALRRALRKSGVSR